jgi:hypothetical protein
VPFVFDTLTFLVGTVALLFIRTPLNGRRTAAAGKKAVPDVKGMTAGLRHVFAVPRLRLLVLWGMGVNFAFGSVHLILIATWHERGVTNTGIGALAAMIAVGGLLGALCTGRILRRVRPTPLVIGLAFGVPPLIAGIGLIPGSLPVALICCAITFFVPALNALVLTYVVAGTPDGLQGRVSSGAGFLVSALQPLSPLLFGTVFDTGGPVLAFAAMGALTMLAALATLSRHLRDLPRPGALGAL